MKIYKYELRFIVDVEQEIEMSINAVILKVAVQRNTICLWAMVEPDKTLEVRNFSLVFTEVELRPGLDYSTYLGTVTGPTTQLVYHIFETQ